MYSVRVYRKGKKNDYVCSSCSKAKALSIVKNGLMTDASEILLIKKPTRTTKPKATKTKSKPKKRTGNPFSFLR